MDDGKELIEMVCTSYESPDDAPEDDQHDFSTCSANLICSLLFAATGPPHKQKALHVHHPVQEGSRPPEATPAPHPPLYTGLVPREVWVDRELLFESYLAAI